jgi:hypothetical protein
MIRRILFTAAAAAALLAAAPVLAAEGTTSKTPCSCCSDGSNHATDHAIREGHMHKTGDRVAQPKRDDDVNVRNQSWGG